MRHLDISFADPAENLALDEVLLDGVEAGRADDTLRLWESPVPFVVIGVGQSLVREVHEAHCREDGVPVLRRCTAGGCVLQGPGCLNFSLALAFARHHEVRDLHASYCYILGQLSKALALHNIAAKHVGICDLALDGRLKVSGNAQRRRRRAMLHHGTLIYRPDFPGMARYLREPEDRPEYRGEREHRDFVGVLELSPETLRTVIRSAFDAPPEAQPPDPAEMAAMRTLATTKYRMDAWTRRR